MPLSEYRPCELEPQKLTSIEIENPIMVIHSFFDFGHIPEIRMLMWDLLKTTVTGNYNRTLSRRERSDMVYFYERLEKLVEAAHLVHVSYKNNPEKKLMYHPRPIKNN
jgi:hypothetical protein